MHRGRIVLGSLVVLLVSACGGHAPVSRAGGQCDQQITLSLAPGFQRSDKVMDDLSDGAGVRLDYLRSASPNLFVYRISSKRKDPGCTQSLARLRQDSRVRFAEPDARRYVFD